MMANDVELINGIRENFRDNKDVKKFKNSQQETLERFVNGQDVFIFQPTNMYESLGSVTSDNKVNKDTDQAKRSELKRQNSQANRSITFYKDSDTSLCRSQAK